MTDFLRHLGATLRALGDAALEITVAQLAVLVVIAILMELFLLSAWEVLGRAF